MSKESNPVKHAPVPSPSTPRWVRYSLALNTVVLAALLHAAFHSVFPFRLSLPSPSPSASAPPPEPVFHECRAPFPPFLADQPPSGTEEPLQKAFSQLDAVLQDQFDQGGIDSLSVAVVGSEGSLYEGFWGSRRANESDDGQNASVDRHSMYRLASISKLFTTIETLILRDRGVLRLDDPISSVCPEFEYNEFYAPITFRALMTHMSGIGQNLPPGNAHGHWPRSLFGAGPPPFNGLEFPSNQQFLESIARNPPVLHPYAYPVYSNAGFAVLGIANVAANRAANGPSAPATHAELVQRDIFEPLGLNGSSFLATKDNMDHVVVSSFFPGDIDQDFLDAMNPSGGQMSSISDLTKLMQVLINPRRPESILSPYTVNEWMRPMHSWFDDYSEVGVLWEIYSSRDSYGRKQKLYQKAGELPGYHTRFTLDPVNSYGIIVLQTGPTSEAARLTKLITSHVQAAFDRLLEDVTRAKLAGTWRSTDGSATLRVEVDRGSLYASEYNINGTDVLRVLQEDAPWADARLPLWRTFDDVYRLIVPTPEEGCLLSWLSVDAYGYVDGFGTNVIVSRTNAHGERVLFLPAIDAELHNETRAAAIW